MITHKRWLCKYDLKLFKFDDFKVKRFFCLEYNRFLEQDITIPTVVSESRVLCG